MKNSDIIDKIIAELCMLEYRKANPHPFKNGEMNCCPYCLTDEIKEYIQIKADYQANAISDKEYEAACLKYSLIHNEEIRIMDMEPYQLYEICEEQGYSGTLLLFRSEGTFYYGNKWTENGIPRYSELTGDSNQYMAQELDCIDTTLTLRELCDTLLAFYDSWADRTAATPKGFYVFNTYLTPAQLARAARGSVSFSDER